MSRISFPVSILIVIAVVHCKPMTNSTSTLDAFEQLAASVHKQMNAESDLLEKNFDSLDLTIDKDLQRMHENDVKKLTEAITKHSAVISEQFRTVSKRLEQLIDQEQVHQNANSTLGFFAGLISRLF